MIPSILIKLFGGDAPAISHYEVKQYTGGALQNTWTASVVHETTTGFAFVDLATNQPVNVSGTVKITGVLASATPATPATTVTTPAA
jgi:hypothetical protein